MKDLGRADRVHVGTCLANGIDVLVSADSAFSGLRMVSRVDPLDAEALHRILGDG